MSENMERGQYLAQSKSIQELNVPAIQAIRHLYERGVAQGVLEFVVVPALCTSPDTGANRHRASEAAAAFADTSSPPPLDTALSLPDFTVDFSACVAPTVRR